MAYRLHHTLHAVALGERTVLLDVERDRYSLLGPSATTAMEAMRKGDSGHHGVAALLSRGIIEEGPDTHTPIGITPAARSAIELHSSGRSHLGLAVVATALVKTIVVLKVRGLAHSLRMARRRSIERAADEGAVIALAQAYQRKRTIFPVRQTCLPDSFALHGLLAERGQHASLVIGVRLDPFAAHCWLQAGDLVVNDSCDTVAGFTPILIQ